jgi:predicted Fe-Mo cluster-binding NifX family protein
MKIAISLEENNGLDSTASTIFGRCPFFMTIDPTSMAFDIIENPARQATGGAGIQAAQWVLDQGATTVISGNLGPKAFDVLSAGSVSAYRHDGGSAEDVLKAFKEDTLECLLAPNANAHSGTA